MTYSVKFVDSIVANPGVRLDLNNQAPWSVLADGTDLSPPPLIRAVAGSLLTDGQTVPASAFDNRVIQLHLQMQGDPTPDQKATYFQTLVRELNRPNNFLLWRPDNSNPVYFRTFRTAPGAVYWDPLTVDVTVNIMAEPFAYGIEEAYGNITIGGDPATGLYADLTNIKGDVETPLILQGPSSPGSPTASRQAVFAVKRSAGALLYAGAEQAEAMTLGTDATMQTVGGYSGAGPNCVRISFATATLQERITGNVPSAGLTSTASERRGRYRVFARVKKSVGADTVVMQLKYGNGSGSVSNAAVTLPTTTNVIMVDLGTITTPYGPDPQYHGYSGTEMGATATFISVLASRVGGAGNLEIDFIALMPASDQFTIASFPTYGGLGSLETPVWDGPNELVYLSTTGPGSAVRTIDPISFAGTASLKVSPGVTNRIYGLRTVSPGLSTDLNSVTYAASYFPRYLYVKPLAS